MNLKDDFAKSFSELKKHKVIAIPVLLSLITPLTLILLFFQVSGLFSTTNELISLYNQYEQEKQDFLLGNYNLSDSGYNKEVLNYFGQTDEYEDGFWLYAEQKGFSFDEFKDLFNKRNIMLFLIFLGLILLSSFYFTCASYALITLNIKGKNLDFQNAFDLTNKFVVRLFSLRLLIFVIVLTPIILGIIVLVSSFFIHLLLGGLSVLLFIILIFAYLIYIGLRLYFSTPILFIENKTPKDSVRESYRITHHHLKQVFVISIILYGISLFIGSFIGSPLQQSLTSLAMTRNTIKFVFTFIIVLFFLILEAAALSFENMFLFYAYLDFNDIVKEEVKK